MVFFRINGKTPKAPTEITHSKEMLDKTERTMDGTMVVDIIGSKDKVDVSWDYLSDAELKALVKELGGGTFVSIEVNAPDHGGIKQITARAENLAYAPYYDWVKAKIMWQSVSVSFVER